MLCERKSMEYKYTLLQTVYRTGDGATLPRRNLLAVLSTNINEDERRKIGVNTGAIDKFGIRLAMRILDIRFENDVAQYLESIS